MANSSLNTFRTLIQRPEPVLCVDIGNSRAKACLFMNGEVVQEENEFNPALARLWRKDFSPFGVAIASVSSQLDAYMDAFAGHERLVIASSTMPLPFKNNYRSETLGVDRLAGICGAMTHFDGQNCLVIDAGTCLTYDIITADRQYMGGAISPGLAMRLRAMHTFSARLPLLSPVGQAALAGLSTEDCMMSGALNGVLFELEGFCTRFTEQYPDMKIVLTGGASEVLEKNLPMPVTRRPRLVLEGLLLLFWWQQSLNLN